MVCAMLGCGGGAEEDALAVVAAMPADDEAPVPAPAPVPLAEPAPAPAAKPLTPASSVPAAVAPVFTSEPAVAPTSPETRRLAMNGISPKASA